MSVASAQVRAAGVSTATLPDGLDVVDARLIDRLQDGVELVARPFAEVATELGVGEGELLARLRRLLAEGFATRFGPLINADAAGGAYMLAALAVPEGRFEEVAGIVNGFDEVAHNYARQHRFNMWFVLAAASRWRVEEVADAIERRTGLTVLRLPKLREYFVDFRVRLLAGEYPPPRPSPTRGEGEQIVALEEEDRALLAAAQAGVPVELQPWQPVAAQVGMAEQDVLQRLRRLHGVGVIRRVALVPNHFRLGYRANGMTVWDVDDDRIDELGRRIGALPFVSHCYRRPRQPGWRYNLFAMVHGRDVAEMQAQVVQLRQALGDAVRAREVLRSTRILKKTGVRLFGGEGR